MNMSDLSASPSEISFPAAARVLNRLKAARQRAVAWAPLAALPCLVAAVLTGCTNAMLSSARTSMAGGNYVQAHQELEAALKNPSLRAGERREVKDGLCATETEIGPPAYSLWRQHQTCADAAREPGSSSGERLAKIDAAIKQEDEAQFDRALRAGDIGGAVAALRGYSQVAPNDTEKISRLQRRLWLVVDRRDQGAGRRKKKYVHHALASLNDDYPGLHLMNQRAFKRWIGKDTSAAGVPMLSAISITGHTLELRVPDNNLKRSALSPRTFARINDAFSVWCQCDGATHVASDSSGLPVYLARLNPEMARSEVLVLPWR